MPQDNEQLTFEDAIERLEKMLDSMESDQTPLAELVTQFEEGSLLLKTCRSKLQDAELKIEKLNLDTNELEPFPNPTNSD